MSSYTPTGTIDVSMPPASGAVRRTLDIVFDITLAMLIVLALPFVIVIGAPIAFVAWVAVVIVQRFRKARPRARDERQEGVHSGSEVPQ